MPPPQDVRSPVQQQRWIECVNVGSQEIPPHGCCEIVGTTTAGIGRTVLQVKRPTADGLANVVLNGVQPIQAAKHGYCTKDFPAFALGTTSVGEPCGSQKDSFALKTGVSGFVSLGLGGPGIRVQEAWAFAQQIKYVKLLETLTPGSWASGRLVEFDAETSAWVDPDEDADDVTLLDLQHPPDAAGDETAELPGWNLGLTNEVFPCYYDPDASWTDYSEEPPAEYSGAYIVLSQMPWAVRRFAKVTATGDGIALGGSGDVEIYHKGVAGGENEPIASGVTVTAWALKWHHTAAIATGTKVMIQWQPDQRRWWIERLSSTGGGVGGSGAIMGYAMVGQNFCASDDAVACMSLIPFNGESCGDDVGTPDLKNTYGLAAKGSSNAPTKVLVVYDCQDGWTIVQVLHYQFNMLTSLSLTQSGSPFSCELSLGVVTNVAVPLCGGTANLGFGMSKFETWGEMRTFTDPDDGVCRLQAKKLTFCSFTDPEDEVLQDLDTWHDVLDFTSQQVVVNVYDNGTDAIQQTVLTLWVPCVDDDADEQLVVEYEECDPP